MKQLCFTVIYIETILLLELSLIVQLELVAFKHWETAKFFLQYNSTQTFVVCLLRLER